MISRGLKSHKLDGTANAIRKQAFRLRALLSRRFFRERVGRGKRYAVGVHTYLKSKAKGKYEYGDLRREARRRPARSDKIAALQRARARTLPAWNARRSAPTTADFMKAGREK